MNSCFDELNNALQEMVDEFEELFECIQDILDDIAEWHDILSAWKAKRGKAELPECFTYGIYYASELSMHPI